MSNSRIASHTSENNGSTILTMKDFLALIKVGIINSNLITTFTGLWLAITLTQTSFLSSLDVVFLTLVGSALVIGGAASLNNYIDRDIDPLMERTKERPTVTGKASPAKVLTIGIILTVLGASMLFAVNVTTGLIGLFGSFAYVGLYTLWSKRYTVHNTVVGSISGAVPPLIGWAAIDPGLHPLAWMLFILMFVWQPPHFYALAMRRVEEYRAAGVPMLPVVKGFHVTKIHIIVWVALLLPIPFFMGEIGIGFQVLATLLNIGWLVLGLSYKRFKEDVKWATLMFVYSLNYLTILFVSMVIFTMI